MDRDLAVLFPSLGITVNCLQHWVPTPAIDPIDQAFPLSPALSHHSIKILKLTFHIFRSHQVVEPFSYIDPPRAVEACGRAVTPSNLIDADVDESLLVIICPARLALREQLTLQTHLKVNATTKIQSPQAKN